MPRKTRQKGSIYMRNPINQRKVAVVGCGFVGAATAFTLMQSGLFSEMVLIDANFDKADGEAKDISHGIPFAGQMKIYAGDYDDASAYLHADGVYETDADRAVREAFAAENPLEREKLRSCAEMEGASSRFR